MVAITPCCLPVFFIITSLAIKQRLYRDAVMVSASFGAGIAPFTSVLGTALAAAGQFVGLPQIKGVVFAIGGAIGYSYALGELFDVRLPLLRPTALRIGRAGSSYVTAFSTGLLLGAGDIGCPNPFRYVLLSFIAASGKPVTGAALGFLYGLGAITPLILAALLALLGINLGAAIAKRIHNVERAVNVAFVPMAAFLVAFGIFGEAWYESTVVHDAWESLLLRYNLIEPHGHFGREGTLNFFANTIFLLMLAFPLGLHLLRRHRLWQSSGSGKPDPHQGGA